jgi:NarL family two-component system sensor histidine kinase YdfH
MQSTQTGHPFRWFLLLWVGLVYIWQILGVKVMFGNYALVERSTYLFATAGHSGETFTGPQPVNLSLLATFTFLMVLHGTLLWIGLSGKRDQRFLWLYFSLQGGLVLVIGLTTQSPNVALSLYLAQTLGAISMLKRTRPAIMIGCSYGMLFVATIILHIQQWHTWSEFWFSIWSSSDYMALLLFVAGYFVLYTQQARSQAQLETAHRQLKVAHSQLAASAERIEELALVNERQRIARELHDTLAQGLAGVIMQIEVANAHLEQQQGVQAQEIMQYTLLCARESLMEARLAINDLRARTTSKDNIYEALQEEICRFTIATGIPCTTELSALSLIPPALHEQSIRVIREGLSNIARHAHANHVWIRTRSESDWLTLEVQDDGQGFDVTTTKTGHYGLPGLHERARLVRGLFEVISAPGRGTVLRFCIPLEKDTTGERHANNTQTNRQAEKEGVHNA